VSAEGRPKKTLPRWVEPVFIAGFAVTSIFEWSRGERFWAVFFALAVLFFGITALTSRWRK